MNAPAFHDRIEAGRLLAARLRSEPIPDAVVVALPRGGVPVAAEVARALQAPLEVLLVRKLGAPWQPELALGALTEGADAGAASPEAQEVLVVDEEACRRHALPRADIARQAAVERKEIRRRVALFRATAPPRPLHGRPCVLVDDGIATGTTVRAALQALRLRGASRIVLAVPVAPAEALKELQGECERIVCLVQPDPFGAVGVHYQHFPQVQDEEVLSLLRAVRAEETARAAGRH